MNQQYFAHSDKLIIMPRPFLANAVMAGDLSIFFSRKRLTTSLRDNIFLNRFARLGSKSDIYCKT